MTSPRWPGAQVAQRHAEELARLQAEVGMLRSHVEQTGPRPPPAILPPPVAPPLLPAMATPELFTVRALSWGWFQVQRCEGGGGWAPDLDRMIVLVQHGAVIQNCCLGHSWGHRCPTEPGPPGQEAPRHS